MSEWTVWDEEKKNFRLVKASSWRDAVLTAYEKYGYLPRRARDVRDRTGGGPNPRDREEFKSFMSKHF